jgi:adenylate kinase family enzyme
VVGCSGSGKTTLARSLARVLRVPNIELDAIFHQPGWKPLDDDIFKARVAEATEATAWVVDGNYSIVREMVWERADTVVWFDLPYAVVMARTVRRTVRRTVTRQELWNGNREPWSHRTRSIPRSRSSLGRRPGTGSTVGATGRPSTTRAGRGCSSCGCARSGRPMRSSPG